MLCLGMKPLKHRIPSVFSALMFTGCSNMGCRCHITVGVGTFLLSYLLWLVVLVIWYRLLECLRGDDGWSFPGGFCRYAITEGPEGK